jgi:hypothetical protein
LAVRDHVVRCDRRKEMTMRSIARREFLAATGFIGGTPAGLLAATIDFANPQARTGLNATEATMTPSFHDALHAHQPAADRADKMGLYGWLVGRWALDAIYHQNDGVTRRTTGEVHAGWVLEGRAIQDVWIVPARDAERPNPPEPTNFYGTTLRVYDPKRDAWHILWSDPLNQIYRRQIGRARGNDIVQEGTDETGAPVRWSFTEITPDSFHWLGERSADGGATFRLVAEFLARRQRA